MMCKTMNAVHADLWPYPNGCGKKKTLQTYN